MAITSKQPVPHPFSPHPSLHLSPCNRRLQLAIRHNNTQCALTMLTSTGSTARTVLESDDIFKLSNAIEARGPPGPLKRDSIINL